MLNVRQISVNAIPGLLGLVFLCVGMTGCGQRGPLYLPKEAAAANRATLPQVLTPDFPGRGATAAPAPAPAAPVTPASGTQE